MTNSIAENLAGVRQRVELACAKAGRDPASVRILAVSKTYGPDAVREAARCGQRLFGENKVQEAAAKIPMCPAQLQWHLIGHLQSNKAAQAARLFDWVHSVDSIKVLDLLERHAGEAGRFLQVLVQVNVSGEAAKSGAAPEAVEDILRHADSLRHVAVAGLMTMPPLSEDPERARPVFRRLRELRDGWSRALNVELPELSMGMTHDLEMAVEEGATFVRVGTGIFGARSYSIQGETI